MDSLFDYNDDIRPSYAPLADRMRPESLNEIIGQDHAVGPDSFLYHMIQRDTIPSILLFGPPGCGKTTIASVIAKMTQSRFIKLNATSSGAKELRDVLEQAKIDLTYYQKRTILFIDEIHRFNKGQQDLLLPYVEDGTIILIGATTENPYFEINRPLLSRVRIIHLNALSEAAELTILRKAIADSNKGLGSFAYKAEDSVLKLICSYASGDIRMALNLLEQASSLLPIKGDLTEKEVKEVAGEHIIVYDKNRDYHYDVVSAFIKSMRGSDPDAALHYLARMIDGGEKTSFISRRIIISAAEDVGLADPMALQIAVSAAQAAEMIGFPEARIPLAEAVIYICLAPKSNSAIQGIEMASMEERTRHNWSIPDWLRDTHYTGAKNLGYGKGYLYPHDFGGWVEQQYIPDELKGHIYYHPVNNGHEAELVRRWNQFRKNKEE